MKNQIGPLVLERLNRISTLILGASWGGVVIFNVPKKLGLLKPRL